MITRISSKPAVSFTVLSHNAAANCVVHAITPRMRLKSGLQPVKMSPAWEVEAFGKLARLRETVRSYNVEDDSEIALSRPIPPDNDFLRAVDGKLYCQQWDEFRCADHAFSVRKQKLLQDRREELRQLLAETDRLNNLLAQSQNVIALLESPILMNTDKPSEERSFALYHGSIWAASRELEAEQWRILINKKIEKAEAQFAVALGTAERTSDRERIASDVRRAVWVRDHGTCVKCGSRERLEFDHIIPVSEGGSNTERNIELLCESCNRQKSDSII